MCVLLTAQIGLATRLEKHELLEFRRLAAYVYKKNLRWKKAVELAKADKYASASEYLDVVGTMLVWCWL